MIFVMDSIDDRVIEERLGKALVKAYGLEYKIARNSVFGHVLIHVRNPKYSWEDDIATYSVIDWHHLLFGPVSLNDHISNRLKYRNMRLINTSLFNYRSLDELDILMTLAGYNNLSEHT